MPPKLFKDDLTGIKRATALGWASIKRCATDLMYG